MGLRWHALAAKFKQRLGLSDLHEATDQAFELAASAIPDMFEALRRSEPDVDYWRVWRNDFSLKLEIIAAEQTRQSQAAECRRLIINSAEHEAQARTLTNNQVGAVTRMHFEEDVTSDMTDEMVQALVAKNFIFCIVDKLALMLLYKEQFNSTLSFDDFDHDLSSMCKVSAEFNLREACYMLLSSGGTEKEEGWDKLYVEVIHPALTEFEPIFRRYKENLCLLSPKKPDATAFYECNDRVQKALEPYLNL